LWIATVIICLLLHLKYYNNILYRTTIRRYHTIRLLLLRSSWSSSRHAVCIYFVRANYIIKWASCWRRLRETFVLRNCFENSVHAYKTYIYTHIHVRVCTGADIVGRRVGVEAPFSNTISKDTSRRYESQLINIILCNNNWYFTLIILFLFLTTYRALCTYKSIAATTIYFHSIGLCHSPVFYRLDSAIPYGIFGLPYIFCTSLLCLFIRMFPFCFHIINWAFWH